MSTLLSIGFILNFQCTRSILGGGVRNDFISKGNGPLINQHKKIHLQIWMANCDLQIVLDEEQIFCYLVKYASNSEQSYHHMNDIIQSLLRNKTGDGGKDAPEWLFHLQMKILFPFPLTKKIHRFYCS